jgi:hypothetical protein
MGIYRQGAGGQSGQQSRLVTDGKGVAGWAWLGENTADPYTGPLIHWPPPTSPEVKPLEQWTQADVLRDPGYTEEDDGRGDWQPERDTWRP